MHIIREEIKKIYHFLLILILLYGVNLGFNMLYDWGGVSVIVRVYIMVLSCYIVYNFSQIDADELIGTYRKDYGRRGALYLFFALRLFPFIIIYLMTVIFTLINYIQSQGWPLDTMLRLMDGRYSNTVIYALILFVVLRLKIRPGIAIPVFITAAILYFNLDKLMYRIFDPGPGVSVIKLVKFTLFYFVLIYGFSRERFRIIRSSVTAAVAGISTFIMIISIYFLVFNLSGRDRIIYSNSAEALLKCGFYQVFDSYQQTVGEQSSSGDVSDLIIFAESGEKKINFTSEQWGKFILKSGTSDAETIFNYLLKKNIFLDYQVVSQFVIRQASLNPDFLLKSTACKKYFSLYYGERHSEFYSIYNSGDLVLKRWIIDVLGYINDYDSIRFLIDRLTDVDRKISERAYESLKHVTKLDPAGTEHREFHDIEVVNRFREYAEKLRKG